MSARATVVVLSGGVSSEHDVARASGRDIAAAIDRDRWRVIEFVQRRDGTWTDAAGAEVGGLAGVVHALADAAVAIPAFHGRGGEDGTVAGLLAVAGVPFVGAGVDAGAIGMSKHLTKLVARDLGITVAGGIAVASSDDRRLRATSVPVVVKPDHGGSSHGLSMVTDASALPDAVRLALADDSTAVVEPLVHGREVDIGVLELPDGTLVCSSPLEIVRPAGELYDTAAKYERAPAFAFPDDLAPEVVDELQQAARRMFRGLGGAGLARVDFFLTASGPVLNEVNTFPGFTSHSQFPRMFERAGLDYRALVATLIDTALARRGAGAGASGSVAEERCGIMTG